MDPEKVISSLQQITALADECLKEVADAAKPKRTTKKPPGLSHVAQPPSIDFDKPLRPFVKQYAKGLSGTKKFVLLLSRLVGGDPKKEVAVVEIQKQWNKMKAKSLLGLDFNDFYPTNAKDHDWVESRKKGFYNLRPSWKEIFEKSNG
jgi:hypothetical protein